MMVHEVLPLSPPHPILSVFILPGTMIMLNLLIGMVMNSMAEMHDELDAHKRSRVPAADADSEEEHLAAIKRHPGMLRTLHGKQRREATCERHPRPLAAATLQTTQP